MRHPISFPLRPLAAAMLLTFAGAAGAAGTFTGMGGAPSYALGISADGSTVVGQSANHAVVWTISGTADLGTLGGSASLADGASADGSVVTGWSNTSGSIYHAFRWTSGGGMQDLGTLGGSYSSASSISADGSTIAGWSNTGGGVQHAFRWTASDSTMHDLGTLGGSYSDARSVSANGSVVVGYSGTSAGDQHAFRWTSSDGLMHDLGTLGGANSSAYGVSGDGTVVVGDSNISSGDSHAFRWVEGGTGGVSGNVQMVDLGTLGGVNSYANGVSTDGNVVVGSSGNASGVATAFRWTQATGMQSVAQWLANANVTVPSGWTLGYATATNSDGSVVVGFGTDPASLDEAWIARVSATGSGIITPSSYLPTLDYNGNVPRLGGNLANLTLFGVHHRALMDNGMGAGNCAWATADASHSNTYNTDQQLAEAGVCTDLGGNWRVGFGAGASYTRQGSSYYGSEGKYNGRYFYAEADYAPASRAWIASLSAMAGNWNTTIRRGYLNAGALDSSTGTPDATIWSLRARMDWKNAAHLGSFGVSPFVSLTHTDSHLDAYTETGGGFPAQINATRWRLDEVRLGTVLNTALSATTDLRLDLEAGHSLGQSGPFISGQVLGLFAFSFNGEKATRTWGRAMVEVDHRLSDKSLISANINAASSGEDPSWGVSIGYKRAF